MALCTFGTAWRELRLPKTVLRLCPGRRPAQEGPLLLDGENTVAIRIGVGVALQDPLVKGLFLRLGQLAVTVLVGLWLQLEDLLLQRTAFGHR